jgi:hypothetical protein
MEVQRAGKKPMRLDELLRGFELPAGTRALAKRSGEH